VDYSVARQAPLPFCGVDAFGRRLDRFHVVGGVLFWAVLLRVALRQAGGVGFADLRVVLQRLFIHREQVCGAGDAGNQQRGDAAQTCGEFSRFHA
jgi:hypothetical protein